MLQHALCVQCMRAELVHPPSQRSSYDVAADLHAVLPACVLHASVEAARGRQQHSQHSCAGTWLPKPSRAQQAGHGWALVPVVALCASLALPTGCLGIRLDS